MDFAQDDPCFRAQFVPFGADEDAKPHRTGIEDLAPLLFKPRCRLPQNLALSDSSLNNFQGLVNNKQTNECYVHTMPVVIL
jgi:hypothetical protein